LKGSTQKQFVSGLVDDHVTDSLPLNLACLVTGRVSDMGVADLLWVWKLQRPERGIVIITQLVHLGNSQRCSRASKITHVLTDHEITLEYDEIR
jgi:hypothetical protein